MFDSSFANPVLNQNSVTATFALPENINSAQYKLGDWYYACGWLVRDFGSNYRNTWHTGALAGTYTLMVRRWDGKNWVVLFNQDDLSGQKNYGEIDIMLHYAADAVTAWTQNDLFSEYMITAAGVKGDVNGDSRISLEDAIYSIRVEKSLRML